MRIDIITLFPEMFDGPFKQSMIKRAVDRQKADIQLHQWRAWTKDKHHTVDDRPYGGGAGMVLKVDVLDQAIQTVVTEAQQSGGNSVKPWKILLTPQGEPFKQTIASDLSTKPWLILICGHYEGFDERIRSFVDQELSIGDYILTGGELAAMVVVDSVVRLIPGVLNKAESPIDESFANGLLEYPQYTRPPVYKDMAVPVELLSGDHGQIEAWRRAQAYQRTAQRRPDMVDKSDTAE